MPNISLPPSAFEALGLPPDSISALTSNSSLTVSSSDVPSSSSQALQPPSTSTSLDQPRNATSITLYAELLLNIRTVTLFASLRTAHNRETKAELSADGSSITALRRRMGRGCCRVRMAGCTGEKGIGFRGVRVSLMAWWRRRSFVERVRASWWGVGG